MNKVQHINLGGFPFTIDEGAYEHLSGYLETIHRHFQASEGYGEITADIEARLAELFQESLAGRTIVTLRDVKDAIVIMGTPEDFGAEPIQEAVPPKAEKDSSGSYRPGKRLFRNPDDEAVGGVCSGIAAYFGIEDPLWIRLLFIILAVSGGFGVPAYIILWAVVPKAKTAGDRLAMRGEPINVSTIGKIVEEEFGHLSDKVQEFGSELSGKKKPFEGGNEFGEFLRKAIAALGQGIRALIDTLATVWKPLLIIVGAIFIFAFAAAWIGIVGGLFFAWPLVEFFTPDQPSLSILVAFNVLMIVGLVLLSIVMTITRLLHGARLSGPWRAGLTAFGVLNVVSLLAALSFVGREFSSEASVAVPLDLTSLSGDTLVLELAPENRDGKQISFGDEMYFRDGNLLSRQVALEIAKAESFELLQHFSSRGPNVREAENWAHSIGYEPQLSGKVLTLPAMLRLKPGDKWRVQKVKAVLHLPVGQHVRFGGDKRFSIHKADKAQRRPRIFDNPGSTWQMTGDGLQCLDCTK